MRVLNENYVQWVERGGTWKKRALYEILGPRQKLKKGIIWKCRKRFSLLLFSLLFLAWEEDADSSSFSPFAGEEEDRFGAF